MQQILWIFTFYLFYLGSGLRHHIRHERTRYVSGKNQIYESDYTPKSNVQDYIPFIHYWERPLQILENSMNVPKKLSSRPLFSWDIPAPMSTYIPINKFTTFENPVNDASANPLTDDEISKIGHFSARIQMSRSDRLNRAKDSEILRTTYSTIKKKKKKLYSSKKSVEDQHVDYLKEQKAQKDEKIKNESVPERVKRKKKQKKNKKGKSVKKNKIGKEVNNIDSNKAFSEQKKANEETNKSEKIKKNIFVIDNIAKMTESPKYPCDLLESKCEHRCQVVNGTATCLCFKGFVLTEGKCVDINECEHNNGGCNGKCINTIGSSKCICSSGFRLVEGVCLDVNECLLRNGHGPCQDKCTNTVGSYYCSCENIPGTVLSSDNHTCEKSGDCKIEVAGCSHSCVSVLGTAFCMCPDGFELGDDWKTCHDIDECSNKEDYNVKCDSDCINTIGSYNCLEGEKANSD